jgi:hypothetical protein
MLNPSRIGIAAVYSRQAKGPGESVLIRWFGPSFSTDFASNLANRFAHLLEKNHVLPKIYFLFRGTGVGSGGHYGGVRGGLEKLNPHGQDKQWKNCPDFGAA